MGWKFRRCSNNRMVTMNVDIVWDWKFFAILPAVNINSHCQQIEFEWLCLGMYFKIK